MGCSGSFSAAKTAVRISVPEVVGHGPHLVCHTADADELDAHVGEVGEVADGAMALVI